MKLLLAFLFVAMTACCATNDGDVDRFDLWRQVALPSVKIMRINGGSGSGVVIHQNAQRALIITAAHVVGNDTTMLVRRGAKLCEAEVLRISAPQDLALLRTPSIWATAAHLSEDSFRVGWGMSVVAFGHPLGEAEGVLTDGRITSIDDDGFLRYSAPTFFGNSGGGVFMKIDGRYTLISISQRMGYGGPISTPYPSLGRGAKPEILYAFLKGAADVR